MGAVPFHSISILDAAGDQILSVMGQWSDMNHRVFKYLTEVPAKAALESLNFEVGSNSIL